MKMKKFKKLIALLVVTNFSVTPLTTIASTNDNIIVSTNNTEELQADTRETVFGDMIKFDKNAYDNFAKYEEVYRIPNTSIKFITNNGGNYGTSILNKMIDGDIATHWETGNPNTLTFKNEVVFTFLEAVDIDKIIYAARQDSSNKGFALSYEIYSSVNETEEDFTLVTSGVGQQVTGDYMEIRLPQKTNFKRLKVKILEAKENWASISEIGFYKEDVVSDKMEEVFSNGTYSALTTEFNNLEAIENLELEIKNHPFEVRYQLLLNEAKNIYTNANYYVNDIISVDQRGSNTRNFSSTFEQIQPIGKYAIPGEKITIFLEADISKPLPKIAFTQNIGHYGKYKKIFTLKPGMNELIAPEIYSEDWATQTKKGGAIYLVNPVTSTEQGVQPKVRVEGGNSYPIYFKGGDDEEFINKLLDYKIKMDADTLSGANKVIDLMEVVSDRMIITGDVNSAIKTYVTDNVKPAETTSFWDTTMEDILSFIGLDNSSVERSTYGLRDNIRLMQPYGAAYASSHVGIQKGTVSETLNPEVVKLSPWLWYHEIGHQIDQGARTWVEITNNVLSMEFKHKFDASGNSVPYENTLYGIVTSVTPRNFDNGGFFDRLGLFWQLQLYDETFWRRIENLYRERLPKIQDEQSKKDMFARYASEVLGFNLTEYFERHGFLLSNSVKEELNIYPSLSKKIWYLNDTAYKYKGAGIPTETGVDVKYIKAGTEATGSSTINIIKIGLSINQSIKDDFLGYEIYRDGILVGFTGESEFIDRNVDTNVIHEYKIIPYGKNLEPAKNTIISSNSPNIYAEENVTLVLNQLFNPLNYIKADNPNGDDLTSLVTIIENTVNTLVKGNYKVIYSVINSLGIETRREINFVVAGRVDYLSDLIWTTATTDYGTVKNDKSSSGGVIKLNSFGSIKEYEKGIGTHANSLIVYDLTGSDYSTFQAYVGVDRSQALTAESTIEFEVWVDGEIKQSSGLMTARTEKEFVNISVLGAKELKLIVKDGGNGNGSDHADFADARLIAVNAKPQIKASLDKFTKLGQIINLRDGISAADGEDGDLTSRIIIEENDLNINRPGKYTVKYSVTDNDGNNTIKLCNIFVVNKEEYLSDINWNSATAGYDIVRKDLSSSGNPITLKVDGQNKIFEKGIGTHANSTTIYDLTGTDYKYFTSYVGVDREVSNTVASVEFEVWVDGVLKYKSGIMTSEMESKLLQVAIDGAKELKLVVNDGGNGIGSDHASFGDSKLYKSEKLPVDKTLLFEVLAEADGITDNKYTDISWSSFTTARESAREVYNTPDANIYQEDIDLAKISLRTAIDELVINRVLKYENINITDDASRVNITENLSNLSSLNQGTIITKFKLQGTGVQSILGVSNSKTNNGYFTVYATPTRIGVEIRNQISEGNVGSTGTTNLAHVYADVTLNSEYNTLAVTVEDGVGYKIYLNGVLVKTVSNTAPAFFNDIIGLDKAYIGKTDRYGSSNDYNFIGAVNYLKVYNTPLSNEYLISETAK